jgi:predicted DNA binding CopG/RHH family protein
MKKKQSASSARARQRVKSVRHMRDSQLDLADIPEATDEQLRRARRVGRPVTGNAKQLIAIRIAPRLLAQLRRLATKQSKPYQTFIHELLERAASKKVA